MKENKVSVPIWGLFNLTDNLTVKLEITVPLTFPSPSGDYLI